MRMATAARPAKILNAMFAGRSLAWARREMTENEKESKIEIRRSALRTRSAT
jgi:hypothetical protein